MDDERFQEPGGINEQCECLRREIAIIGGSVRAMMNNSEFNDEQSFEGQHGEMKANIMLSYRHLEDARMRLGKV